MRDSDEQTFDRLYPPAVRIQSADRAKLFHFSPPNLIFFRLPTPTVIAYLGALADRR